jgi:predicted nucleic acid-binding protein
MSVDGGRQFVDSNVVVYAYDASAAGKNERARTLLADLWETGNGCLSVQVLLEFFVSITRKVPQPLDARRAARVVEDLAQWRVHAPQPDDVVSAIEIHQRASIAIWDALIVQSALQLGCEVIWSEDLNPGQVYRGVIVRNPFLRE